MYVLWNIFIVVLVFETMFVNAFSDSITKILCKIDNVDIFQRSNCNPIFEKKFGLKSSNSMTYHS